MNENTNGSEPVEDYTPDIFSLLDEDGTEHHFELIDRVEHNELTYIAVVPHYSDPDQALKEEPILVIFRMGEPDEEGFETFDIVEDDEEHYEIGGIFATRLQELYDIEE